MLAPDIFPAPAFEGSEKRLELDWAALGRPVLPVPARGLRALTRQQIATLLEATGCCIVSSRSCVTFDAYVLSESSLFLYETKFVIKTCGTTKTLALVPQLLRFAADLGLAPTRCKYSRATFLFPAAQPAPYNAWEGEVELLNQLFGHLGSSHACTLGQPSAGCLQWHLFVAQAQVPPAQPATPTGCSIEICSTGLCPRQALSFHRADSNFVSAAQTTAKTGIRGAASIFRPRHMAVAVSWSGGQSASYSNSSGLLTGYHQMGTWTEALPDGGSVTFTQFAQHGLEDPVWVADLGAVKRLYEAWVEAMPRVRPFYAAKCNMDPGLLAALSSLGAGFDCASEAELRAAVQAGASPGKDIVFANACKRPRDIRAAASMGVNLTTFDTPCEVQKLAQYHPGTAALLRIRADDPDA
ncbi:hypothetical protein WJX84_010316, partial [Apatococcus fuscideae]